MNEAYLDTQVTARKKNKKKQQKNQERKERKKRSTPDSPLEGRSIASGIFLFFFFWADSASCRRLAEGLDWSATFHLVRTRPKPVTSWCNPIQPGPHRSNSVGLDRVFFSAEDFVAGVRSWTGFRRPERKFRFMKLGAFENSVKLGKGPKTRRNFTTSYRKTQ